jgi:hypothetical protein
VLLDAETVPYVPKLFIAVNTPKQVRVSSHCSLLTIFAPLMMTYINIDAELLDL